MRIAVIGGGVSGCLAARLLATRHDVTLFEANDYPGGHAQTVTVDAFGEPVAVDAAFMVYNDRTYPNFSRMLGLLGVASRPTDMSFSVCCPRTGLEYQGGALTGLFAQPTNALRPGFLRMIADILQFNRLGRRAAADGSLADGSTVRQFVDRHRLGDRFVRCYLAPMAAAIWSCSTGAVLDFPAAFLIGFFANHGLLQLRDRPQWRTVSGGSANYVTALLSPLGDAVRLNARVTRVRRTGSAVEVQVENDAPDSFDHVVFATHADQTLRVLQDATEQESRVLGCFPYQSNSAVLHTDARRLPRRRRAWASWNYRLHDSPDRPPTVTYDLTRLQGLRTRAPLLLTLNDAGGIDPAAVIREFAFSHPCYSAASITGQSAWREVSGAGRVHFCGAYWGFGFHEDGVNSALRVAHHFGIGLEACTVACTRARSRTAAARP